MARFYMVAEAECSSNRDSNSTQPVNIAILLELRFQRVVRKFHRTVTSSIRCDLPVTGADSRIAGYNTKCGGWEWPR